MNSNINRLFLKNKPFVGYPLFDNDVDSPIMIDKETPFERVEQVMRERKLKAPALQKKLGILSQHWNNWRTRGIPANRLFEIAEVLGVYPEWVRDGAGPKYKQNKNNNGKDKGRDTVQKQPSLTTIVFGSVPLITWDKLKQWCRGENVDLFESEKFLPCPVAHGNNTFSIVVEGDAMTSPYPGQRSYPAGTIIFVDPNKPVVSGSRVVAIVKGCEPTFKEYREDSGQSYLMPLNPKYPPKQVDLDNTRIIGAVIGTFAPED